jgi:hypothetical protein
MYALEKAKTKRKYRRREDSGLIGLHGVGKDCEGSDCMCSHKNVKTKKGEE